MASATSIVVRSAFPEIYSDDDVPVAPAAPRHTTRYDDDRPASPRSEGDRPPTLPPPLHIPPPVLSRQPISPPRPPSEPYPEQPIMDPESGTDALGLLPVNSNDPHASSRPAMLHFQRCFTTGNSCMSIPRAFTLHDRMCCGAYCGAFKRRQLRGLMRRPCAGESWKYMTAHGLSTEVYSMAALREMAAAGHPLLEFRTPVFRADDGCWLPVSRVSGTAGVWEDYG